MRHIAVLACLLGVAVPVIAAPLPEASRPVPGPDAPARTPQVDRDGDRLADGLQAALAAARTGDTFRVVVTYGGAGDAVSARQAVGAFTLHREFRIVRGFAATMTAGQIRALAKQPGVLRIEEDFPVSVRLDAARADFGADAARAAFGVSGAGVKGCIVDTGIDPAHEQLNDRPIVFHDLVNGRTVPYDDHGHGTHVASIAFGDGTGGAGADRYRGVAPAVTIHAVKALDSGGFGLESQVIAGIDWCVAQGVRIVSMSLGSGAPSDGLDAMSQAANAAVASGVVVVAAAGNAGDEPGTVGSPGAAEQAIAVAACAERSAPPGAPNHSDGVYLAAFSSRGPTLDGRVKPDVCAPGHSITAALAGTVGGYVAYSGTSMATPFVAGAVALALQADPSLTPAQVRAHLEASAQDRGPAGKDNDWGAGLVDGYALLARVRGLTAYTPTAFPAYQRVAGSVPNSGSWTRQFTLAAADLAIPIAAMITIDGKANCLLPFFGSCLIAEWTPDLDARLLDPNGVVLAESLCQGAGECGGVGRQETLHAMPTVAGAYTIQVNPSADSVNRGKGGSFVLDLSTGPLAGAAVQPPPAVHVGALAASTTSAKNGWRATVTITLHDAAHALPGFAATVSGNWSNGASGSASCSIVGGLCSVTSATIAKRTASVRFTVTGVTGALAYQPASNEVTSITVAKP